ncbi:calcium-dependent protein kinase 21 [Lysobacter brunescens]|uniref:Calcium-dependent protein kinase 21 n=1 Tax=Lysobacter brunescens TaxID=262323 RepID=A0ABW2YBT3_9GAMM
MSLACRLAAVLCLAALPSAGFAQSLKWSGDVTPPASPSAPAAPPAPADAPQRTGDYLTLMDTNRDQRVSPEEYQDWLSYAFDGMDRNRDGVLTADEQPGGRGKTVTRDEHRLRIAERFRRQDRDRNGFLDAQELSSPPQ